MEQGFHTLKEVVDSYLLRRGENSTHLFSRMLAYAIDGLRELNYDVGGSSAIKTAELPINQSTLTVNFPDDYIDYVKIGVCHNGNIYTLGLNEKMCTIPAYNDCGDELPIEGGNLKGTLNNYTEFPDNGYYFWNYQGYGRVYAHGGGFNGIGYYKPDVENRRFRFNSDINTDSIVLEYVSSGYSPGVQTLVHAYLKESLIAWMRWKDVQYKASASVNDKESAKREYALARRHTAQRMTSFTLDEFIQASRTNYKQGVKN